MQNSPQNTQAPNVPGFLSAKPQGKPGQTAGGGMPAQQGGPQKADDRGVMKEVAQRIKEAENVLVALSSDPSIDEIATAIGLTTALDAAGKYATAIYSGETPNVLEFLKPEETFETNTDSLQDFIIALNKDKADHLRYKIDGDFVKVYITPYKTTIGEEDLEFSRGDFNVDLVIGLNVPAATELDSALKEHGRIMNDASTINITNGAAGKFGDVEWVNEHASSVAEMVAEMAFEISKEMDQATATALLTGIVSATDKFTNQATTPESMLIAAKLMKAGADQQEVIQNISMDLKFTARKEGDETEIGVAKGDGSSLSIKHGSGSGSGSGAQQGSGDEASADKSSENNVGLTGALAAQMGAAAEGTTVGAEMPKIETKPMDPVQAAMASAMSVTGAPETNMNLADQMVARMNGGGAPGMASGAMPEARGMVGMNPSMSAPETGEMMPGGMQGGALPASMQGGGIPASMATGEMPASMATGEMPASMTTGEIPASMMDQQPGGAGAPMGGMMGASAGMPANQELITQGVTLQPTGDEGAEQPATDYGKMIDDALAEPMPGEVPTGAPMAEPMGGAKMAPGVVPEAVSEVGAMNPAMVQAPSVEGMAPAGDVPQMDYSAMPNVVQPMQPVGDPTVMPDLSQGVTMPMPGDSLAPPPTPPTPDFGAMPPSMPSMPAVDPNAVAAQPGAYQIPGM